MYNSLRIKDFEWDRGNLEHISRHNVDADEAEEAFLERHFLFRGKDRRYILLGRSGVGRFIFVVFELKGDGIARVITARDMTSGEKRLYWRKI